MAVMDRAAAWPTSQGKHFGLSAGLRAVKCCFVVNAGLAFYGVRAGQGGSAGRGALAGVAFDGRLRSELEP